MARLGERIHEVSREPTLWKLKSSRLEITRLKTCIKKERFLTLDYRNLLITPQFSGIQDRAHRENVRQEKISHSRNAQYVSSCLSRPHTFMKQLLKQFSKLMFRICRLLQLNSISYNLLCLFIRKVCKLCVRVQYPPVSDTDNHRLEKTISLVLIMPTTDQRFRGSGEQRRNLRRSTGF